MIDSEKKYIVVADGNTYRFNEQDWSANKDDFMKDFPTAEIAEVDAYNASDLDDNDNIIVNTESGDFSFSGKDWKTNETEFMKDFPTAQVSRVRGVDYYYNQANELDEQIKKKDEEIKAWQDSRTERTGADWSSVMLQQSGLSPIGTGFDTERDEAIAAYAEEGTRLQEQRNQLQEAYDNNPRVKTAREEWEKNAETEFARYQKEHLANERQQVLNDMESDVDANAAMRGKFATTDDVFATFNNDTQNYLEKEKLERYQAALQFYDKAEEAIAGQLKGFWKGIGDVAEHTYEQQISQKDIATYTDIFNIMQKLEKRYGTLKDVSDEQIERGLEPSEKALLKSYFEYSNAIAQNGGDKKYKAGQQAGQWAQFAIEFALGGKVANAATKGLSKGVVAGLERWAAKALEGTFKGVARNLVAKAGTMAIKGIPNVAIATALRPSTYTHMAQAATTIDKNGHLNPGKEMSLSFLDDTIETISEKSGELIGKVLGVPMKHVGKWTSKAWDAAFGGTKFSEWGKLLTNGPVSDYLKQAGFHGYPIEILEEYVGNAMRLPMDSDALKNMHRDGNGYAMLVGFLPATLIGGGISAAQFGFAQKRAMNSASALQQMLIDKKFGEGRAQFLSDYKRDMSPLELGKDMYELKQELEAKGASQDELQMVSDYATAVAEYQTLRGGMKEMQSKEREQVMAELEGQYKQFYKVDESGNKSVDIATDKNGRRYFVISPSAMGEVAAIDKETGAQVFLNESDINTSENVSLDNYLDGVLQGRRELAQMERMTNERYEQIAKLSELLPKTLNLGTKGNPNEVVVKDKSQRGVTVVDAEGNEIILSWDQVGRTMGMPIEVLTDAQIAEAEAAAYGLGRAEKKAQRATTQAEVDSIQRQGEDIAEEVKNATPKPEDRYRDQETGEVDENTFWENDPEGYCQWNDSVMQDNGADSLEQIESGMAAITKRMAELDKMAFDDPKARKVIKAEKIELQSRLNRLTALQQKYTQAAISDERRRAEQTLQYRERIEQWRKKYGIPVFVYESLDEVKDKSAVATINKGKTPGWQNRKGVHIYLPHVDSMAKLEETLKHETTGHAGFALLDEKSYNELMDKVWAMMSDSARNTFYNYPSVANKKDADTRRRKAAEEFASHVAEQVDLGKASAEQKTIWERIVDFFRRLFSDDDLDSNLIANAIRDNHLRLMEKAQETQKEVESFMAEAQEQTEKGLVPEEVQSDAKAANGTNNYSTATYHSWVDNLGNEHTGTREEVLTRMQNMGFPEAEIKDMAQRMDTAYAYMEKLRRLTNPDGTVRFDEFNRWAEKTPLYKQIGRDYVKAITSLVSNGDYPVNLEITTDCIKREAFTQLLNELVKRGAELSGMGPGEIVTIQKMMKQYGIEVACNLCFVEGKRLQIINWASQIVNDWNDALVEAGVETDEFFEFGKDGDAFIPADEWRTYEDKSKVAKVMRNLDDIALLFQGLDPKTFKAQKRKNKKALEKYIKEKAEKAKKPVDQWKPNDEQKREMKKIANEGLYPTYVNENMEEYRNAFNAMRNEWLDKNPNADPLSFNPTQKQWDALGKIRNRQIDNVRAKMVRLIMEYPEMRKKMTLNDLLGSKGLMEIRQQHGQAYADLYSIILQRFGTGTPKPVQDAVPYDGEVMTLSKSAFKKANEIGGARLFSFSDFDITKVFDYMQMFFDLEANRQMLQSYTKEVAAVLIFGRSNAKFNISTLANAIVPDSVKEEYNKASEEKKQELRHKWAEYAGLEVDAEGNIIGINFSEEHSVSPAFAQQIFHDDSRNKDCGAIMVGASVNHAIFSAAQQWIRMVIPFHLSGMPMAAREKTDVKWYTDNTAYQSTRKKTKDGWSKISSSEDTFKFYNDMNKEGWNMRDKTREYLAWCAEKGFRPKFDWGINSDYYRAYCEENGYTPNQQIIDIMDADTTDGVWNQYYKFLTDFTAYKPVFNEQGEMIDEIPSPQLPVQSNFDFTEMEKDVLFEGERSMLEHREGNIQRTNRHIEILAEQAAAYLNGDITEEEMGLRDDVHFENTADAERYLEEVAKENGMTMFKSSRRAQKQMSDDEKRKEVEEIYGGIWIGNKQEYAKFVHAVNNWYFEKDGIGLVYADIHHAYQYYWNENGEPIPFRMFYISDSTREEIDNLIKEEHEKGTDDSIREVLHSRNDSIEDADSNAERDAVDNTAVPMPFGDGSMAEDILREGAFANSPELYVVSSRPNGSQTLFKTANNNQAIFVSNAAKAVEGIKMEKATPEQWLKMLEKNGGLKAGEDKWMGLSDWLKASDKKTLTKQEVLDYVNEHMIQIEEVYYAANAEGNAEDTYVEIQRILQNKFDNYMQEYYESHDVEDDYGDEARDYAMDRLHEEFNDEFPYTIERSQSDVYLTFPYEEVEDLENWAAKVGIDFKAENPINDTRLNYTTEDLDNKREIALTVPTIVSWNESDEVHFGDAGDGRAVAWIRFGETTDESGNRVLVIDEIQSKRHQEGREKGYKDTRVLWADYDQRREELKAYVEDLAEQSGVEEYKVMSDAIGIRRQNSPASEKAYIKRMNERWGTEVTQKFISLTRAEDAAREAIFGSSNGVPDAPFDKNWHELAMKRMLRYAAENGYDVVAWTKGDQQAERYNIGGIISEIKATKYPRGYEVVSFGENGSVVHNEVFADESAMAGVYGKEMAQRIIESVDALEPSETATISGDNLRVGGEGMKGFYDRMLPAFMDKYGKKWGVKTTDIELDLEGGLTMHSIPVTEEMKESMMEGQTMFKTRMHNQSAESFALQSMRDYVSKYGNGAMISVMPVNDATAKKLGYDSVDDIKDTVAEYLGKKGIAIFAHEDITDSDEYDTAIYHESIHHLAKRYPQIINTGKYFWDNAENDEAMSAIKAAIDSQYANLSEKDKHEEMLCFAMEYFASDNKVEELAQKMQGEDKKNVELINSKTNYGKSRSSEAISEDSRAGKESGVSDKETEGEGGTLAEESGETLFKSAITPEVRKEMDTISAQAIVNGNYLKAPNGKDTKLTPEQWALVRTKNFKDWFGDWENDPENASKVVDENGEPMVVHHGTISSRFSTFDDSVRKNSKAPKGTYWFAEDMDNAMTYAGSEEGMYATFLNLRTPAIIDAKDSAWYELPADFEVYDGAEIDEMFDTLEEAQAFAREHNINEDDIEARGVTDTNAFVKRMKDSGKYDGVIIKNVIDAGDQDVEYEVRPTNEYVVFSSNQIKSATENNGEYSEDEDIRFKTRTKPAPVKTQEVYKLMRLGADGKLYPLFIGSAEPIELGTWYDAESPNLGDLTKLASGVHLVNNETGEAMTLEEFKAQHPEIAIKGKKPNVAAVNWATENGARWIEIEDKSTAQRRYEGESRSYYNLGINGSGQVGQFAMRPGWHAGSLPTMRQIGKGKDKNLRDDSFVWVEGRIPADVDYQSEADANPDKDIPTHIPTDGFYMKATNANKKASQSDKMGWYVAGSFIADRIMSDAEAREVIDTWNAEHPDAKVEYDYPRESGKDFVPEESTNSYKTTAEDYATMPVDELVEKGKMRVAAESQLAADEFMDRIRTINGALNQLRKAAAAQRKYDQNTIQILASLANDLLASGKIADPSRGEIKRLISVLNGATGKSDLTKYVDRLMDIMIDNQLRHGRENLDKFLRIRGKKVDTRGVEVKGRLDIPGQQIMDAIREHIGNDLVDILFRMVDVEEKLTSESEAVRRNAENELIGLEFAKQYVENIKESEKEEKRLRQEIKDAEQEYKDGIRDRKSFLDFVAAVNEAIRENHTQRVLAYQKLIDDLAKMVTKSIQGSKLFNEREKERVAQIQHFANSDMQGMPADMHGVKENRFWNSPLVRFFLKPLATFDQMLRSFAPKSTSGEGYLWNHFMGGWTKATESEYKGVQKAHEMLDSAARTMFGEGVERWSDLFAKERKMPKITIKVWDNGEMVDKEISQGNALYIYMVNKMTDGKMKLRKMGISQEDVDAIVAQMDPRFITLADWMQERFLPSLRDKYNAVHERLFGAPMASIDNYFPIKVNPGARTREVDVEAGEGTAKPATITGSIIKRTKNSLALDIMNADAFDVMLEHIQQMEHWAAFAEFNKDLNTLLSYRKFRNRVENMSGIYGSGKTVWSNFKTVAEIAAGVYQPASKSDSIDKTALNVAKGVTGAKISFRVYTAIKQLLSMPAFVSDANIKILAKNIATPWIAWNWAMENLPMFEKRWKSRQAGDTRLMQTDSDWKIWKYKIVELAGRYGMTPNAFIDAVTVSIGARSIYETKYQSYLDMGYSEEQADKKAKQDATILFNESQQSNESAFLSAVQVDRTVASVAFTVFRNSAMGYQRMAVDAWRNISHMMRKGYKEESIEYMKKQMVRDGLTEEQAERAATRVYNRSFAKNAARLVTFQFLVQFAWNLGAYLPYLLVGDDDDEKKAMVKDAAIRGLVGGPIEGMAGGSIVSNMAGNLAMGEKLSDVNTTLLPVISDIEKTIKMLDYDKVAAYNEMFNILIQSGIGVNPQTFTDFIVAIEDACNGEPQTSKEVALCILRVLQIPQTQADKIYIDEIDFTADKGLDLTIYEFAKRYADYKVNRGAPMTGWLYSDEMEKERENKYIQRFTKMAEEYKRSRGNDEAKKYYEYLDNEYKEVTETLGDLKSKARAEGMKGNMVGAMEYAEMLDEFMKTDAFERYTQYGGMTRAIEKIRDKLLKVDAKTRNELEDMMLELRKEMVEEMEKANL
jgi:hypothetical protein